MIQTYVPDHYCIESAAKQDYEAFYEEEKAYRSLMSYPPFGHMLAVFMESEQYNTVMQLSLTLKELAENVPKGQDVAVVGPCDATIARINDRYRRVLYLKYKDKDRLIGIKDRMEQYLEHCGNDSDCYVTFDFDPLTSY